LAFETLIPKSIIQRYVSLLVDHRRIILCGPGGTGKTFLAHRLAEYLVLRSVFVSTDAIILGRICDFPTISERLELLVYRLRPTSSAQTGTV